MSQLCIIPFLILHLTHLHTFKLINNNTEPDISPTTSAISKTIGFSITKPDTKLKLILNEQIRHDFSGPVCKKESTCEPLQSNTCFGVPLLYTHTSLSFMGSSMNQSEVQRQLQLWTAVSNVPRCWSVIRPLLCSVYMPRCENGTVDLPTYDLCLITRTRCRIVEVIEKWPEFLRCDKPHFAHHCKNEWREVKFNSSTAKCAPPLVKSDHALSWIGEVEGCGLPCNNPLYTDAEHHQLRSFIIIVGSICLSCCLFAVMTFIIDWENNKYPGIIIFVINICFLIVSIGWMAQFTPGAREDIVCRKDGTLRLREPSSGENLSCVIIFIMIYYFVMAGVIWFVFLTYAWFMSFRHFGKIRQSVKSKMPYFHLAAWSLPLILTITVLALGQIDGDSESGICFVGSVNIWFRIGFVVLPIFAAVCAGGYFLVKSLQLLIKYKMESAFIIKEKSNAVFNTTIFRIATFLVFVIFLVLVTIVCHLYEFLHRDAWLDHFRNYLVCEALRNTNPHSDTQEKTCEVASRPSVHMSQLHIIAVFVCGIVMSSWIWTESTIKAWKRFFRRLLRKPDAEPKLTKNRLFAKSYANKQDLQNGRISVSLYSRHEDPLGMNLDLNSATSHDGSSTWTANISKFLCRHGGLATAFPLGARRNSSASEDFSMKRGPHTGSRRHSLDSQISLQSIELERLAYLAQARKQRRRKKREGRRRSHSRILSHQPRRRSSNSSQHSFGEKKSSNADKESQRPGSAFTGKPPLSELPILAPIRRNSASSNRAAEDLLNMATSSGEDSSMGNLHDLDDIGRNSIGSSYQKDTPKYSTNESNFDDSLSCAIRDAVWGSRGNESTTTCDSKSKLNPKIALELETIRPLSARLSHTPTKKSRSRTPLNNLRQFPLLSRTALDIDGDSDIRETSSS